MVTAIGHALMCSLAGALLGAGLWAAVRLLGPTAAIDDLPAVGLAALGGAICASLAGGVVSLLQHRKIRLLRQQVEAAPLTTDAVLEKLLTPLAPLGAPTIAPPKTRRRPALRGVLTPAFRWQATSR